jgi:TonB family protein
MPRTALNTLSVELTFLCACLLCAGAHAAARAQTAPPMQTFPPVSADTSRGIDLYQQGDIEGAIEHLKKGVQETPNDADAWRYLGLAYERKGDEKNARKALARAVQLRFARLNQRALRVVSRQLPAPSEEARAAARAEQTRRYEAALETIEAYLRLNPKDATFWRAQAESLQFYNAHNGEQDNADDVYSPTDVDTKAVILSKPLPQYTEEARRSRTSGRISLRVVFAADGTVQHILVLNPLPDGLTEQAIAVAKRITFQPAIRGGRPVSQLAVVEYGFSIY